MSGKSPVRAPTPAWTRIRDRARAARGAMTAFSLRKQRVARLIVAADSAAWGLWIVPSLGAAWHWSDSKRAAQNFAPPPGLRGRRRTRVGIAVVVALAGPAFVWVPPTPRESRTVNKGGTHVIVTKGDGCLVFDYRAMRVTHYRDPALPETYRASRDELSAYFTVPAYELSPARTVLREDLVEGIPLAQGELRAKVCAAHILARQSAQVVAAHRGSHAFTMIDSALRDVIGALHGDELRAEVVREAPRLRACAPEWPMSLSHGDLTGLNVILAPRPGCPPEPVVIDLEDARDLPYFYDWTSLLVRDPDLWQECLDGEFANDITALTHAAGGKTQVDLITAAQVVALIATADHANRYGGEVEHTLGALWPGPHSSTRGSACPDE